MAKRSLESHTLCFATFYAQVKIHAESDRIAHFHEFAKQIAWKASALPVTDPIVSARPYSVFDCHGDYQYIYFKNIVAVSIDTSIDRTKQLIVFASLYLLSFCPSRIHDVLLAYYSSKMPFTTTTKDILLFWNRLSEKSPWGTNRFQPRNANDASRLSETLPKMLNELSNTVTTSPSRKVTSMALGELGGFGPLSTAHLVNLISSNGTYAWQADDYSLLGPGSLFALNGIFLQHTITQSLATEYLHKLKNCPFFSKPLKCHELELLLCEYQKYVGNVAVEKGLISRSVHKYFNSERELNVPDKKKITDEATTVMKHWLKEET